MFAFHTLCWRNLPYRWTLIVIYTLVNVLVVANFIAIKIMGHFNGFRVTLFSIRWRARGPSPLRSQKVLVWLSKNHVVRGRYFIDKYAISSPLKHFCGNESKSNFRLRTRPELAASKLWHFGDVWTQKSNNVFESLVTLLKTPTPRLSRFLGTKLFFLRGQGPPLHANR